MGFFPLHGKDLRVFLTFMEVFPIPPLSRRRSGGGWGIYVAVALNRLYENQVCMSNTNRLFGDNLNKSVWEPFALRYRRANVVRSCFDTSARTDLVDNLYNLFYNRPLGSVLKPNMNIKAPVFSGSPNNPRLLYQVEIGVRIQGPPVLA